MELEQNAAETLQMMMSNANKNRGSKQGGAVNQPVTSVAFVGKRFVSAD